MKASFGRDILKGSVLPFDVETSLRVTEKFFTYSRPAKVKFSHTGRWMNHFMLGADPEFMFLTASELRQGPVHATTLGLKAGLAFGADQNDRLVELRAAPSRDAIKVLGSILAELRWLYRYLGDANNATVIWNAQAFAHGDGMGGHVHFGRKRPQREDEIRGLDGLAKIMRAADLFDTRGWARRCEGDQFSQMYGQYGDTREQKHGYEYRTLPTWLDSPRLAYLVLVLSKLVILDPDITASWLKNPQPEWALLQGLAKYYKSRDDDALVLYSMMDSPETFKFQGGDFRPRWGLTGSTKQVSPIIPSVIDATPEDLTDLTNHLMDDVPLEMRETPPNFRDSIPSRYQWVPRHLEYRRRPNIGDIFYDMVQHEKAPFSWDFDNSGCVITVPVGQDKAVRKIAGDIVVTTGNRFGVLIGMEWRKGASLSHLRKVLYSGALPLWKVDDVKDGSFAEWQKKIGKPKKRKTKYEHILRGL
jgi:Phage phiEco32-like COOH.NH2 ligase-type 2